MYVKQEINSEDMMLYLKNFQVIYTTGVRDKDRRVGKSQTIAMMAIEGGIPIFTKNRAQRNLMRDMVGGRVDVYAMNDIDSPLGIRFTDGILVDEISESDYKYLKRFLHRDVNIMRFVREDI